MKRRDFLRNSSLATIGTLWIPSFVKALEQSKALLGNNGNQSLVIIQLGGGNDGLNTFVPYQNDIYYRERPRLSVPSNTVLKLNDELGLNPVMQGLKEIYDQGWLTLINNVGYPNPDRSHFRSMDIWQSASDADQYLSTGWIGRYLDAACAGTCANAHTALEVDDSLSLALKGENIKGLALKDAQKLYKTTQSSHIKYLTQQAHLHEHEETPAAYLYKTLSETTSSAAYIREKVKTIESKATYPQNDFGRRLKTIAEFIQSGLETKIYYASLTGFDTHVNQKMAHERLLQTYADAVKAFVTDLNKNNQLENTLVMTFSEFGRRVKQNASNGTDHGTANNVWLIGGKLKKAGVFNVAPNLNDLDEGDLKFNTDFRSIYATLLKKHLQADDQKIIGKKFDLLDFI